MNSRKWIGATLFAALLLGVGVGVLLGRFVLLPSVAGDVSPRPGRHEDHGKKFRARLHEELDLNAEQQERLDEVLGRNHEIAERFWKESRERFDQLRVTFRADIRELLTAEQIVKFDRLLAEHDEKRRNRDAR